MIPDADAQVIADTFRLLTDRISTLEASRTRHMDWISELQARCAQLEADNLIIVQKATEGFEALTVTIDVLDRRINRMEQANGS